jgi:hypothetical protein
MGEENSKINYESDYLPDSRDARVQDIGGGGEEESKEFNRMEPGVGIATEFNQQQDFYGGEKHGSMGLESDTPYTAMHPLATPPSNHKQ